MACDRCKGFGDAVTYENQASMPIKGRVVCVDWCIHRIVAALNAGGVGTVASCCGHGSRDGTIVLADGRELIIRKLMKNHDGLEELSRLAQEDGLGYEK